MKFSTRKWIKPEDLNPNGTLFGGSLLKWVDEEAAIYAILQTENPKCVTKLISEIEFSSAAEKGDIIELGIRAIGFGTTSITLQCEVRNKLTQQRILFIDRIVFVTLDENGIPTPHGKKKISYSNDRIKLDDFPE